MSRVRASNVGLAAQRVLPPGLDRRPASGLPPTADIALPGWHVRLSATSGHRAFVRSNLLSRESVVSEAQQDAGVLQWQRLIVS